MEQVSEKRSVRKWLTFLKWGVIIGLVLAVFFVIFAAIYVIRATKDLPSVEVLAEYKPPVMTRVHAGDGKLITEYSKEARVFVPIESIPKTLQYAFVSAEDQRFYEHNGFDLRGFTRAMVANIGHVLRNERLEGGSTLTQQVAKNFLVGNERNIDRKIREIVIARRIEKAMDKDHILELYLNEIYFGRRAYGVAAASLRYFAKPMEALTLSQQTYFALLAKGPNNYRLDVPAKKARAISRRNYVLSRMVEDGYITQEAADEAANEPLELSERLVGDEYLAAEYFVEEARKQIFSMYGEDELYSGGLSIRTTLDTKMQLSARRALRRGLEMYDRRHGYRGAIGRIENFDDWKTKLGNFEAPKDIGDWRVALVLETNDKVAKLGFAPDEDILPVQDGEDADLVAETALPTSGTLNIADIDWAAPALPEGRYGDKPEIITDVVKSGDIILVQAKPQSKDKTEFNLRQIPEVNGALMAMDPHTGRVLALVGGYSFDQSQFNRATQAYRQPGSAFKPFVYAAALDQGYTPSSQVLDAPFVIARSDSDCPDEVPEYNAEGQPNLRPTPAVDPDALEGQDEACEKFYKPTNYAAGRWYGLSTLRLGLEKSRNAMTVRLANDIGMAPISRYGRDFGIYDTVKPELAWALGAGETTLLRISNAYSMLVNGGKKVTPTILDRVQDGKGQTIYVHGDKLCEVCRVDTWTGAPPPELPDEREAVIDPITAYQMTFMLKGVVDNGTGRSIKSVGRPLGGKTGTTNNSIDAWFVGFSPDLVAGVYVGFDNPKTLGAKESGSSAAAPIFRDFMKDALKGQDFVPFRIPENVTLSPVNRETGEPSYIGAPDFILEAFRPGTEPRLGELKSTIRIGGGSDTFFGGGGFDFEKSVEAEMEAALENAGRGTDDADIDTESESDLDQPVSNKTTNIANQNVATPTEEEAKSETPTDSDRAQSPSIGEERKRRLDTGPSNAPDTTSNPAREVSKADEEDDAGGKVERNDVELKDVESGGIERDIGTDDESQSRETSAPQLPLPNSVPPKPSPLEPESKEKEIDLDDGIY